MYYQIYRVIKVLRWNGHKGKTAGANTIKLGDSLKGVIQIYFPRKEKEDQTFTARGEIGLHPILLNEIRVGI